MESAKSHYEQKARQVHKKFQELFNKIKQEAQKDYAEKHFEIQREQKRGIEKERENLGQALKEQDRAFQKDRPLLVDQLVEKIKS